MRLSNLLGTGAAIAVALTAAKARADITALWNSSTSWRYRATEMPDLDQGRAGLPNTGFMYCGPAAATNILLYAAHHGSPRLLDTWSRPDDFEPGTGTWFAWRAGPAGTNEFYGHGSANITQMAGLMSTSAQNGTSFRSLYWGLRRALGTRFSVSSYGMSPWYTPTLNRVGRAGKDRGAIIVMVGYYQVLGQVGGMPLVVRNGGHFMTLDRALRLNAQCLAWTRDPADDLVPFPPPAGVLASQSAFRSRAFTVIDRWVVYGQWGIGPQFRYMSSFVGPGGAPAGSMTLLDGFITIRPRAALVCKVFDGGLGPIPALQRLEPATWSNPTEVDEWILSPSGTEIIDYAPFGAGESVVMLTAPVDSGDPTQVWLVNQFTEESELVAEIPNATALVGGDPSDVWVQAGDELHLVWIDPTEAEYPEGETPAPPVETIALPGTPELVRYDQRHRQLLAFDMDDHVVHVVTPSDPPVVETRALPVEFPAGASVIGDIEILEDDDGRFLASVDGSTDVIEVDLAEPIAVTDVITVSAVEQVTDLSIGDGRMFVAGDGQVGEYVRRGADNRWQPLFGGDFADAEVEQCFRVVESRTNFDPAVHDNPEFDANVDPEYLVYGEPAPECMGDLNFDGIVNALDLLILLAEWGPVSGEFLFSVADLDVDFTVNVTDLLALLTHWGPCP